MPKQKQFTSKQLEALLDRARMLSRGPRNRIGATGYCLLCHQGTTGGESNLCYSAREGRNCLEKIKQSLKGNYSPVPASTELLKVIKQLKDILDA